MKSISIFFILALTLLSVASSCEVLVEETPQPQSECQNMGYLKLTNGSSNTIQKIVINGTNYGSLDPGDSETIRLGAGRHDYQFVGVNGGGCYQASVLIVECETEARICRN